MEPTATALVIAGLSALWVGLEASKFAKLPQRKPETAPNGHERAGKREENWNAKWLPQSRTAPSMDSVGHSR